MTNENSQEWNFSIKPEHETQAKAFVADLKKLNQEYPDVRVKTWNETDRQLRETNHMVEKIEKQGAISMSSPRSSIAVSA